MQKNKIHENVLKGGQWRWYVETEQVIQMQGVGAIGLLYTPNNNQRARYVRCSCQRGGPFLLDNK